jgi:hypothetical protein
LVYAGFQFIQGTVYKGFTEVANCYIKTHSRHRMVVGFTTACAFIPIITKVVSLNPVLDITLCDKVCQ